MRHDDYRAATTKLLDVALNRQFSLRIKRRRSFIQYKNLRRFVEFPCYTNPLPLTARKQNTVVSQGCVFGLRKRLYTLPDCCGFTDFPEPAEVCARLWG